MTTTNDKGLKMSIKKCFFGSEVETALLTVSFLLDKDHGQQQQQRRNQKGEDHTETKFVNCQRDKALLFQDLFL